MSSLCAMKYYTAGKKEKSQVNKIDHFKVIYTSWKGNWNSNYLPPQKKTTLPTFQICPKIRMKRLLKICNGFLICIRKLDYLNAQGFGILKWNESWDISTIW